MSLRKRRNMLPGFTMATITNLSAQIIGARIITNIRSLPRTITLAIKTTMYNLRTVRDNSKGYGAHFT